MVSEPGRGSYCSAECLTCKALSSLTRRAPSFPGVWAVTQPHYLQSGQPRGIRYFLIRREGFFQGPGSWDPNSGGFWSSVDKFPTHTGLTETEFLSVGSYNDGGQALWAQVGPGAGV